MLKTKFFKIALIMPLLFLTACELIEDEKSTPRKQVKEIDKSTSLACYLNTCFETSPVRQIDDPNKNYQYPSAAEFPNPNLRPQYRPPYALLDLQLIQPGTFLSQNFKVSEFMSRAKGQYGLFSSHVLTQLQLIRNAVNRAIRITSGYRSPGYNRQIDGSAKWSRHTYGDAVDFSIPGLSIPELEPICAEFNASFSLQYERHIHCDWRLENLDPAFYKATSRKEKDPSYIVSPRQEMESESAIRTVFYQDHVELSVVSNWFEIEEEGLPIHNWTIVDRNGTRSQHKGPQVELSRALSPYEVDVRVGGAISLQTFVKW